MYIGSTNLLEPKLKLSTRKLKSGNYQVKFQVSSTENESNPYGYLLAEPGTTLKEVVSRIMEGLDEIDNKDKYYHYHLYSLHQRNLNRNNILLFNC